MMKMEARNEEEVWLNTTIPKSLRKRLDEYCKKHGLKIKFVVAKALEEYLEKHTKQGP
ncbi:MAG: hypothetical protein QXZ17_01600 [Nitrososphaerota archaeon]